MAGKGVSGRCGLILVKKTHLERVLHPRRRMHPHLALDPNQRLDLRVQPITHQLELPVRRDETDGPVVLEPRQPHALMELDVLHLDGFAPRRAPRGFKHDFIVEPQPQFRHPGQVALQFDGAQNLAAQHIPRRTDQQVQTLNDIQKHLVLPVPDAFAPPADGVGDGDGRARLDLELV